MNNRAVAFDNETLRLANEANEAFDRWQGMTKMLAYVSGVREQLRRWPELHELDGIAATVEGVAAVSALALDAELQFRHKSDAVPIFRPKHETREYWTTRSLGSVAAAEISRDGTAESSEQYGGTRLHTLNQLRKFVLDTYGGKDADGNPTEGDAYAKRIFTSLTNALFRGCVELTVDCVSKLPSDEELSDSDLTLVVVDSKMSKQKITYFDCVAAAKRVSLQFLQTHRGMSGIGGRLGEVFSEYCKESGIPIEIHTRSRHIPKDTKPLETCSVAELQKALFDRVLVDGEAVEVVTVGSIKRFASDIRGFSMQSMAKFDKHFEWMVKAVEPSVASNGLDMSPSSTSPGAAYKGECVVCGHLDGKKVWGMLPSVFVSLVDDVLNGQIERPRGMAKNSVGILSDCAWAVSYYRTIAANDGSIENGASATDAGAEIEDAEIDNI